MAYAWCRAACKRHHSFFLGFLAAQPSEFPTLPCGAPSQRDMEGRLASTPRTAAKNITTADSGQVLFPAFSCRDACGLSRHLHLSNRGRGMSPNLSNCSSTAILSHTSGEGVHLSRAQANSTCLCGSFGIRFELISASNRFFRSSSEPFSVLQKGLDQNVYQNVLKWEESVTASDFSADFQSIHTFKDFVLNN